MELCRYRVESCFAKFPVFFTGPRPGSDITWIREALSRRTTAVVRDYYRFLQSRQLACCGVSHFWYYEMTRLVVLFSPAVFGVFHEHILIQAARWPGASACTCTMQTKLPIQQRYATSARRVLSIFEVHFMIII